MLLVKDLLLASGGADFPTDPVRFDYTGAVQTYTVPQGCRKIHVDAVGAGSTSVAGGRVECDLDVTENQTYYIYVGNTLYNSSITPYTFNGGSNTHVSQNGKYSGGGATDIRTIQATAGSWYITNHSSWDTDSSLLSRLIVAGGAGGGYSGYLGGLGGGTTGGSTPTYDLGYSTGGSQTSGGIGYYSGNAKENAFMGVFGAGAFYSGQDFCYAGAGAGWYGGGISVAPYGGGGSSYTHPSLCSNVIHTQGYSGATGNGWLIITPLKV